MMSDPTPTSSVERMFPFVIKSRILIIGRDTLQRSKSRLHFVLITLDISETSRAEVLKEFLHYPVVQRYAAVDLEKFFGIKGAKTIGFAKSGLAQSIYAELKEYRINKALNPSKPSAAPAKSPARKSEIPRAATGSFQSSNQTADSP
jgi:hypothetical protein